MEEVLDHPWCFWYKVFKVGRKNSISYVATILIIEKWATSSTTKFKSLDHKFNIKKNHIVNFSGFEKKHEIKERL
jgi:hypothetical protein